MGNRYTVKALTSQPDSAHKRKCLCDLCMANQRAKKAGVNRKARRSMQKRARKKAREALKKK